MRVKIRGYVGEISVMIGELEASEYEDNAFEYYDSNDDIHIDTYTVELVIDANTIIVLSNVEPEEIEIIMEDC